MTSCRFIKRRALFLLAFCGVAFAPASALATPINPANGWQVVPYTGAIVTLTATRTGQYAIYASGGSGGDSIGSILDPHALSQGGLGMSLLAVFSIPGGSVFSILAGGRGGDGAYQGGGGGGGASFVSVSYGNSNDVYLIAGGGGGGGSSLLGSGGRNGGNGRSPVSPSEPVYPSDGGSRPPGGGGGGGYDQDGEPGAGGISVGGAPGQSLINGAAGGAGINPGANSLGYSGGGGFGGGGAGGYGIEPWQGGGGGGGGLGGLGGDGSQDNTDAMGGVGGASFINNFAMFTVPAPSAERGNGMVAIRYLTKGELIDFPGVVVVPEPASMALCGMALAGLLAWRGRRSVSSLRRGSGEDAA